MTSQSKTKSTRWGGHQAVSTVSQACDALTSPSRCPRPGDACVALVGAEDDLERLDALGGDVLEHLLGLGQRDNVGDEVALHVIAAREEKAEGGVAEAAAVPRVLEL